MQTSMVFNLWQNEWLLYERVEFDGATRRIYIHPEISEITVREHLYSAWKRWVTLQQNAQFPPAMRTIGGDNVGGGQKAGDIYFLMNEWQIVIDHNVNVTGILYHDDQLTLGLTPYIVLSGGGVVATVSSLTQLVETSVPVVTGDVSTVPAAVWSILADDIDIAGSFGEMIKTTNAATNALTVDMGALQTDVGTVLSNLGLATDLINTLLKYNTNRTRVDQDSKTMIIYDDDGVTPIKVFNLKNFLGQASVTEVAERLPQ